MRIFLNMANDKMISDKDEIFNNAALLHVSSQASLQVSSYCSVELYLSGVHLDTAHVRVRFNFMVSADDFHPPSSAWSQHLFSQSIVHLVKVPSATAEVWTTSTEFDDCVGLMEALTDAELSMWDCEAETLLDSSAPPALADADTDILLDAIAPAWLEEDDCISCEFEAEADWDTDPPSTDWLLPSTDWDGDIDSDIDIEEVASLPPTDSLTEGDTEGVTDWLWEASAGEAVDEGSMLDVIWP